MVNISLRKDKRSLNPKNKMTNKLRFIRVTSCLDPKILHTKTLHPMFGHMYEVLNKICLQNLLHGWVVNREMNLMNLLNP